MSTATSAAAPPVRLAWTVHVPAGVWGVAQGAAAPVVALAAREHGASLGVAGLVVALAGLGQLIGDLPAGRLVSRFGERRSIVGASVLAVAGVALCLVSWSVVSLAVGVFLAGLSQAVWGLARQTYLAEAVPFARRARVMSSVAAMMRVGFFVGPILGAAAILAVGTRGGFAVQLVAVCVTAVLMGRVPDVGRSPRASAAPGDVAAREAGLWRVLVEHSRLLRTLGLGAALMGLSRTARTVLLPLWADLLGVDAATTSLVFGASAALDVLVSIPAGYLMDRFGRRALAVPSLAVLATGYLTLPWAGDVASLAVVALVLGFGNGLSNGVIMTLGADVAPPAQRAEFFGAWRLLHDAGAFAGPLVVAGTALVAPLAAAALVVGATSVAGGAVFWRYVPVWAPWPRPVPVAVAVEPVAATGVAGETVPR